MSNELNGPVGSPVGLVSGTGTMSVPGHPPAVVVPHTGQFLVFPQPLRITNNAVTRILSRILVFIQSPAISSGLARSQPSFVNCPLTLHPPSTSARTALESELQALQHDNKILRHLPRGTRILKLVDCHVHHVLHPVIRVPVETQGDFVGVIVVGRN